MLRGELLAAVPPAIPSDQPTAPTNNEETFVSNQQYQSFSRTNATSQDHVGGGPDPKLPSGQEDPIVKMLQQITSRSFDAGDEGENDLQSDLMAMLGDTGPKQGPNSSPSANNNGEENTYGYVWRIIHAFFALALAVYITAVTSFTGAPGTARTTDHQQQDLDQRLFWIFATVEVVLQSSRFFLDRGKSNQVGWLGMLTQVLPDPWRGYVATAVRYSGIWTTTVADAMIVVFVLGCVAWWNDPIR